MNNISFSYLFQVLRAEKSSNGLSKLDYDLFDDISKYLKLKQEILEETDRKEEVMEELKSIIQIVKELYEIRLAKTIDLAKNTLTFDNFSDESLDNLSKFEQEYFKNIVQVFGKQKKWLYDHFEFYDKLKEQKEEEKEPIDQPTIEIKPEIKQNLNQIKTKFVKDTPKFMGLDLKFKGPYKMGEIVVFEKKQAEFLLKKQLVEFI